MVENNINTTNESWIILQLIRTEIDNDTFLVNDQGELLLNDEGEQLRKD